MRHSTRVLLLLGAVALVAAAQDDPPGRVGRLTYMSGQISFRPGDVEDWVAADVNRPLTTGDHLWIDEGARAELSIGNAVLRLNSRTAFEFLNLNDNQAQIRLTEGSLQIRVRGLAEDESFEVDTPNLAFSLLRPGEYRIDVNPDNQVTNITVRSGEGEATGGGQAFAIHAGEQTQVSGGDQLAYNTVSAPDPDEWDDWCLARDRREDESRSARYVSRDMVGYQDLDNYGSWRDEPQYGPVWVPSSVAAGWAPYHYGHWVWVEPWGWTWVDDAPWGFAPFHYGRWVYVGYWAWVPGPVAVRPVYCPALVAWIGGSNFGVGVSFGGGPGVAWIPLGPREVYVPGYRASNTYINRVNVTNTTIVNNVNITNVYNNTTVVNYVNRNAPNAVTAVPQNALANSRPVQNAAVRLDPRTLTSARIVSMAPVAPTRQAVLGSPRPSGRAAQPPMAIQNRTVVAKTPPPPAPVPFAQRQSVLNANPGRPLDRGQVQQLRSSQPTQARPFVRPAQPAPGAGQPGPGGVTRTPQYRPATPPPGQAQPSNVPPARRDIQNMPPRRDIQNVPPARRDIQNQPGTQREMQNVPPPRVQPSQPPAREVQPAPRVQRDVPPPRSVERPVETPRPQREVRPPAGQTRPAPKPPEKDQKKDKKEEKKQ